MLHHKIHFILFITFLSLGGLAFLFQSSNKISIIEKRKLCEFPSFSTKNLLSGKYTDSIDLFVADNFVYREFLVDAAYSFKDNLGFKLNKVVYYKKQVATAQEPDSASLDIPVKEDTVIGKSEVNSGVVIYEKRAFQLFTGVRTMEKKYADMVNKYHEKFGETAKIYEVLIPMVDEFYLPEEYKAYNPSELKSINSIHSKLADSVVKVNAYDEIQKHTSEYLFFNTDHHWTARGAYHAYSAFCKSANISTIPLSSLEHKVKHNFLGSLYWLTRDKELRTNIDSVEYFKSPAKYKAIAYTDSIGKPGTKIKVYNELASGNNAYGVFLGSDFGLVKINTSNTSGRKALIIKNSYGNPFSTYFLSDFDEINVLDYRYFKGNLSNLVKESQITHIVFITPIMTANTKWHTKKMLNLL